MKIAIIGAGMAGLACAEALGAAGCDVTLFDKGRRAGGRLSTRRIETALGIAAFDHGAQYFSTHDPAFRQRVERWEKEGKAARWPAAGDMAWVGIPGMSAPVAALAAGLDVRSAVRIETVRRTDAGWSLRGDGIEADGFEALAIAVPAEQVGPLVSAFGPDFAARAAAEPSQPCWTVMAAFDRPLPIALDVLKERGPIGWAARNSAKPGRAGPEAWVIQAGPAWSVEHLEDERDAVTTSLLRIFADEAGVALPTPIAAQAHRWRYARSGAAGLPCLWDAEHKLGACGDWLIGPRVEGAWLSGTALARAITG